MTQRDYNNTADRQENCQCTRKKISAYVMNDIKRSLVSATHFLFSQQTSNFLKLQHNDLMQLLPRVKRAQS